MTDPYLHFQAVRKTYGDVVAADCVELEVPQGEFMTFLGPSGSGKSTTLYILAGFQDPTAGDITLRGSSILPVPPHKRNIGMVFQRYTLFPHLSVRENVAFPLRVRRQSRDGARAYVTERLNEELSPEEREAVRRTYVSLGLLPDTLDGAPDRHGRRGMMVRRLSSTR